MSNNLRNERGFALIAVLWALVFLGAVTTEVFVAGAADRAVAANVRASARGRWMARAGLAHTLNSLHATLTSDSARTLTAATEPVLFTAPDLVRDGVRVGSVVVDVRAYLSLNHADPTELRRLALARGADGAEAQRLALAVEEWRGSGPQARRFHTVAALLGVPQLSEEGYGRVASLLTTAGDGRVNVNTAPLEVLQAVLDVDPSTARLLLARRTAQPFANTFELVEALPRLDRTTVQADMARLNERLAFAPREVEIVVRAEPQGSPMRAELSARLALNGGQLTLSELVER